MGLAERGWCRCAVWVLVALTTCSILLGSSAFAAERKSSGGAPAAQPAANAQAAPNAPAPALSAEDQKKQKEITERAGKVAAQCQSAQKPDECYAEVTKKAEAADAAAKKADEAIEKLCKEAPQQKQCAADVKSIQTKQKEDTEAARKALEEKCKDAPDKAKCIADAAPPKASSEKKDSGIGGLGSPNLLLQFGVVTLDPFEVKRDQLGTPTKNDDLFTLESDDVSARFMIEASANLRWAWGRFGELERSIAAWPEDQHSASTWLWSQKSQLLPDFQSRLGFTFGTDKNDTSSAVGSGDMHGEIFLGWDLFRLQTRLGSLSIGPEAGTTIVTDRSAQDIHNNVIAGGAIAGSILVPPPLSGEKDRLPALFIWRLGYSSYEIPHLDGDTDQVKNENGFPDFRSEDNGVANIAEFHYPIGSNAYASAIGRFYNGSDPNPWSFNVGVSIQIDGLVKGLAGLLNNPPSATKD